MHTLNFKCKLLAKIKDWFPLWPETTLNWQNAWNSGLKGMRYQARRIMIPERCEAMKEALELSQLIAWRELWGHSTEREYPGKAR